jgi:hypothetical protein
MFDAAYWTEVYELYNKDQTTQLLRLDEVNRLFAMVDRNALKNRIHEVTAEWDKQGFCPMKTVACKQLTDNIIAAMSRTLSAKEEASLRTLMCHRIFVGLKNMPQVGGLDTGISGWCVVGLLLGAVAVAPFMWMGDMLTPKKSEPIPFKPPPPYQQPYAQQQYAQQPYAQQQYAQQQYAQQQYAQQQQYRKPQMMPAGSLQQQQQLYAQQQQQQSYRGGRGRK